MKTVLFLILCLTGLHAGAQGRVVINEYMPWTGNGCNTTSEFIELLNFGPGPVDIGCYTLTEGDYAITIPPNTILQPGQYYVISGQSTIPVGCANLDSAITVDLNWNSCTNCVSAPIPQTGDGLFTDGGSASEQLVLLDPNLKVIDAVVRNIDLKEPSGTITTAGGFCAPRTFDLDEMTIHYEMIGESAGRANSFARKVDGSCEWLKDSRQSADATNNTSGETSEITYTLIYVRARDCDPAQRGAVYISVDAPDVSAAFPITYTLSYDLDSNGVFDLSDQYVTGVDSVAPYVEFNNLAKGRYRVSVGSTLGCNLKTFEFDILDCSALLPLQILEFKHEASTATLERFSFKLADFYLLQQATLEQSTDGKTFYPAASTTGSTSGTTGSVYLAIAKSANRFFRLRLVGRDGSVLYSAHISLYTGVRQEAARAWPNPADNELYFTLPFAPDGKSAYRILNMNGATVQQGFLQPAPVPSGQRLILKGLPAGIYHLVLQAGINKQPIVVRFVKR